MSATRSASVAPVPTVDRKLNSRDENASTASWASRASVSVPLTIYAAYSNISLPVNDISLRATPSFDAEVAGERYK